MRFRVLGFLGLAGLVCGAPGAFAFTIVTSSGSNGAAANLVDPDQRASHLAGDGRTSTYQFGGATLQMDSSSSYGWSPALQDRFVENPAARLVPSLNR